MGSSSLCAFLCLVACVCCATAENEGQSYEDRINAFRRCIADTGLPSFNTTKPFCPLSSTDLLNIAANSRYQSGFNFGCNDLMRFADYITQQGTELGELSDVFLNTTHSSWLSTAAYRCFNSATRKLCLTYGMCISNNVTKMYQLEACEMEFLRLVARGTNGVFNENLYTYLMARAMLWSNFYEFYSGYNPAIPQHFLYTCKSQQYDINTCILYLFGHCFEIEEVYFYYPYWCYYGVKERLCVQFNGDERLRCHVVVETRLELSLESQCADEKNEGKCDQILAGIVDNKPISQLNTSDVDQMKAVIAGSAQRSNYTNETLTQLNRIVDYFSLNESIVASVIDKQDANTFLSVINTLASEEGTRALGANSSNNSGAMLLHDLDEISKVIGLAVVSGNDKVDGKYTFNDRNIGLFLAVGSDIESYSSGELRLNRTADTNSSNSHMSATITIPSASVCESEGFESGDSSADDDEATYYYDYPKICQGRPSCTRTINGIDFVFYDFYTLFGDCSRRLHVPNGCPSVVATSIADNIPSLLSDDLPSNMSVGSLILSSQIVVRNQDNTTSVSRHLKQNATLQFKLIKPVNLTTSVPRCYYWDTVKMEWSDTGIETETVSDEDVRCVTNHLTSFAVLIDHRGLHETESIPSAERQALSIVGYIGPGFSVVCLVIALIIMILLRKRMNKGLLFFIHLNLCISLLLALTVLLVGLETADEVDWLCSVVAGLLHYLFLCVFTWMLAEGVTLFVMVVYVWGVKLLKWYIFLPLGWGIPIPIVAISAGIRHNLYGTNKFCWLSSEQGLMWAFLGPVVLVCVINTVFLTVTIVQIVRLTCKKEQNKSTKSNHLKTARSAIVGSVVLFPLLGITWIIGIFAVSQKTTFFLWLFTILNSLQGVFILIFHVLKHQAFLTWIARKCPCAERWIEVHSSTEATRRLSVARHSVSKQSGGGLLSDKFGVKAQKSTDLQLTIIDEEDESGY